MKTINTYISKIVNFLTTVIIILLVISIVSSFQTTILGKKYNNLFGYTFFEIKTASMAGTMEIGDWILVKITDDVSPNDIITFEADGAFITHRVIEQYQSTYITKGDSNTAKDTPVNKNQIVGKLVKVLPKFGIVKKTLFNTKVLIILMITIVVGCWVFQKDNQPIKIIANPKKNVLEKPTKPAKKETKEVVEERIDIEETVNKMSSTELSKTMVLSKITVDMNSKTLNSLSKKIEDTTVIEPIDESSKKESIVVNPTKITKKKVLLGKNEKNLLRKGIELKENQLLELVTAILDVSVLEGEYKAIANKFIDLYIEEKYLNQYDLEENITFAKFKDNVNNIIANYKAQLINETNVNYSKSRVIKIANIMQLINKIDTIKPDIEKIIKTDKLNEITNEKQVISKIKTIIKKYNQNIEDYYQKIETTKFQLISRRTPIKNLYYTNISSNIQFSKLFSNYSISNTYGNEVVIEELRELQLKMLSIKLLKEMLNFSFNKQYLIPFPESIYSKDKKLNSAFENIQDIYSQSKIIILLDIQTLILNNKKISEFIKQGYNFAVQLDYNNIKEISNITKHLCLVNHIFILNGSNTQEKLDENISDEIINKIVYIEKDFLKGPVIE